MSSDESIYQKCGEIFLANKCSYTFLCYFCNELLYKFEEFRTHTLLHLSEIGSEPGEIDLLGIESKIEKRYELNSINEYEQNQEGAKAVTEEIEFSKEELEKNYMEFEQEDFEIVSTPAGEKIEDKSDQKIFCSHCQLFFKPNSHDSEKCSNIQGQIKKYDGDFISLLREGILCCCECHTYFKNYKKLYEHHKSSKHCTENDQCKVCKFHTFMDAKMNASKQNKQNYELNTEDSDNNDDSFIENFEKMRKKRDFRFKCPSCEKIFRTNYQLKNHIKIHNNDRPYKCEMCSAAFTIVSYLKAHIINKHTEDRPFSCEIEGCDAKFKTFNFKKQHEKTHRTGSFQCEMCGNYYKTKFYMLKHQQSAHVDANLWPYQCEFCNRRFVQPDNLADHKRTHTGEKPFGCDICSKFFRKRSNLREHKKLHSEERKYVCRLCGKGFKQAAGYWGHMKKHPLIS